MSSQPAPEARTLWRESALSTRTLSNASVFLPSDPDTPITDYPSRKSTLTAIPSPSDDEMLDIPLPPPSPPPASPLLRLPRELRLSIFAFALSSPLGINFPTSALDRSLAPQLLRLSRAVHAEALPLLYGGNKLIFSHPSDANVFRHALADGRGVAAHTGGLIVRVKNTDARLWTAYFNSLVPERSLVKDFPALRILWVRYRGPRYMPHFGPEQNCLNWLRDAKLVEIVPAVRKCVEEVRVEVCVKVPEEWDGRAWEVVVERLAREEVPEGQEPRRRGEYVWLMGVWVKLETEGT